MKLLSVSAAFSMSLTLSAQNGPVRIWEEMIELPTYRVAAPEKARCLSGISLIRGRREVSTLIR